MNRLKAQMRPADIIVGLIAGLVATQVTNFAQPSLQRMTPKAVRQREQQTRLGDTTSLVAARHMAGHLALSLNEQQMTRLGKAIHFGTGMAWGPVYGLLRCYGGLGPVTAGLVTGVAMSLILDEAMVPALGLSAANQTHSIFTHIRGYLAHLVYGGAAALVTERLGALATRPMRTRTA